MVQKGEGLPRSWPRGRIDLLHRRIRKVTIVSDGNVAGHGQLNRARVYPDVRGSFNELSYKIFADIVALYAGQLAQKRFAPRSLGLTTYQPEARKAMLTMTKSST
jgi:hypothetical protein